MTPFRHPSSVYIRCNASLCWVQGSPRGLSLHRQRHTLDCEGFRVDEQHGAMSRPSSLSNGVHLFAGTQGGGVYLSRDRGQYWTGVSAGLSNKDVWALTVAPPGAGEDTSTLFAGTYGSGIFRSPTTDRVGALSTRVWRSQPFLPSCFKGRLSLRVPMGACSAPRTRGHSGRAQIQVSCSKPSSALP